MPNTFQLKRSSTAGAVPASGALASGELAVNTADGRLFLKKSDNSIVAIGRDAGELNTGTVAAARLPAATGSTLGAITVGTGLGVAGGTVSVSYGSSSSTACVGNDARLSDARAPLTHAHGNITNAGAIGSTANLPVITQASGVLTTGSFGSGANTFCQGNDARLACQAWVNFNGAGSAAVSGTYSQSGSTITVTITSHGLTAGQAVWLSFTSGTATTTGFVVATVISSSSFTVTATDSKTTTGNVTATRRTIRASNNVSSVVHLATGDYWINFSTAMVDANYAVIATAGGTANAFLVRTYDEGTARSTWAVRLLCATSASGNAGIDPAQVAVAVFR